MPTLCLEGHIFTRSNIITKFKEGNAKLLLLSLEKSPSGMNVTEANHVVFIGPFDSGRYLDPTLIKQYEKQAIARCRRYGQTKTVYVYRFYSVATIEQDIINILEAAD